MKKNAQFRLIVEALKLQLGRFSVTLLTHDGHGNPGDLGSGTCVDLNGRRGIFTVAHLVYNTANDCISIALPQKWTQFNSYIHSVRLEGGGAADIGRPGDAIDVAFLELSDAGVAAISPFKQFLSIDRMEQNVASRDQRFMVYGTPRAMLDEQAIKDKKLILRPICYVTEAVLERPEHTSAEDHIVLEYPREGNIWTESGDVLSGEDQQEGKLLDDLKGISGGGIWTMPQDDRIVWSPESAVLVGIETGWFERGRRIIGNQIQHALAVAKKEPRS